MRLGTLLFKPIVFDQVKHSSVRLLSEPKGDLDLSSFLMINRPGRALIEPDQSRLASYPVQLTALRATHISSVFPLSNLFPKISFCIKTPSFH